MDIQNGEGIIRNLKLIIKAFIYKIEPQLCKKSIILASNTFQSNLKEVYENIRRT
jgi:hypothetical protein